MFLENDFNNDSILRSKAYNMDNPVQAKRSSGYMKKMLITLIIFLSTSAMISYAGINENEKGSYGSGALYGGSSNNNTSQADSNGSGLYRASSADNPGNRPGNGEGIGQEEESPAGNGLHTLLICCFIYGLVKLSSNRKNIKRN